MILFPHGNGKLIHDAAVDAVKFIFRILTDQRQLLIAYLETKKFP